MTKESRLSSHQLSRTQLIRTPPATLAGDNLALSRSMLHPSPTTHDSIQHSVLQCGKPTGATDLLYWIICWCSCTHSVAHKLTGCSWRGQMVKLASTLSWWKKDYKDLYSFLISGKSFYILISGPLPTLAHGAGHFLVTLGSRISQLYSFVLEEQDGMTHSTFPVWCQHVHAGESSVQRM